jgi:hypothetical protein
MLGRTREKVTDQRIGGELHEGFDHFRSAASLAAGRAAERIAPAVDSARASTREMVAPRVEHAREAASRAWEARMKRSAQATKKQAKSAEKLSRRARRKAQRASMDANRLGRRTRMRRRAVETAPPRRRRWMLGALGIGAALGAISAMVSRRRPPEWEEYEPMERGDAVGEKVTEMADAARRRTGTVVESGPGGTASDLGGRHSTEPGIAEPPMSGPTGSTGPNVEPSSIGTPNERPPAT